MRRVGSIFLLRNDGAALLQRRDDKPGLTRAGQWVTPGGHCDSNETMEACARREFREETAYECGVLSWLSTIVDPEDPACRCAVFWARYDQRQTLQCLEGQELKFVPRSQAAIYDVPVFLIELWDVALTAARVPFLPAANAGAESTGSP